MITSALGARLSRAGMSAILAAVPAAWLASMPAAAQAAAHPAVHAAAGGSTQAAAARPPGRQWPSFAFDPQLDESVLFGGQHASTVLGDTWVWQGNAWTEQQPASSPSARTGAAMVYDDATGQLLLFGGSSRPGTEGGFLGDTWVWDGTTWTQLDPASSPPARHNADMVYDSASNEVILFGGYDGSYLNDTWAWDGTTWTQLHPATSPSPRDSDSLAYDQATGTAILFGGFGDTTGRLSDTWSWDGTTWTQLHPASSPGVVTTAWQAAYDAATQQVVLFGGDPGNGGPAQDGTWAWNGTTWTQLSPALSPAGRVYGSMTYNTVAQRIVLFGGSRAATGARSPTRTWVWDGTSWHRAD